ncbi:MAG: YkgJ family cysteine cluster protein [Candidatus Sigynarchaeota archaeon]
MPTEREKTCMSCAACCRPTEMLLTPGDVQRIEARGHDVGACTVPSRQHPPLRQLKTVGNRCYFLEGPGPRGPFWCSLYPDHPAGCKLYPLVYDEASGKAVIDKKVCPHWKAFQDYAVDPARRAELARVLRDELHII